ncbi:hypothetical protein A4G99_00745 [Haladaptatus sp. R4]|nr:hypothetical protein A4G99_00745 [Haladaptatus sp. R4]
MGRDSDVSKVVRTLVGIVDRRDVRIIVPLHIRATLINFDRRPPKRVAKVVSMSGSHCRI